MIGWASAAPGAGPATRTNMLTHSHDPNEAEAARVQTQQHKPNTTNTHQHKPNTTNTKHKTPNTTKTKHNQHQTPNTTNTPNTNPKHNQHQTQPTPNTKHKHTKHNQHPTTPNPTNTTPTKHKSATAENRTRVSRVAGENSTTRPRLLFDH